ncbi:MAG: HAD family hydrolase [Terriglobia bacterium]
MLRAIIFDFDGVIVDSEPVILELTQQMAAREGWNLSAGEYYRDYLALDDRGIVEHLFHSHGKQLDPERRNEILEWKIAAYRQAIRNGLPTVPGAVKFVERCRSSGYHLAIASGSLREEVEHLLKKAGLREYFSALATAEDSESSKPHPGVYLKAVGGLQRLSVFLKKRLEPEECLAIEDAPAGVDAAHAAGLKCLAVAYSQPPEQLSHADWIFQSFAAIDLEKIAGSY